MDVGLVQPTTKLIELKKDNEINIKENNATLNDIKELAYLFNCLGVY